MGQFAERGKFGVLSLKWDAFIRPSKLRTQKDQKSQSWWMILKKQYFQNTRGTYKLKDSMKAGMRPTQAQAK